MSQISLDENRLKELIKSAMRDVLEERDDMLNEALEAALEDVDLMPDLDEDLPAGLAEPEDLEDLAEQLDGLLNELANSSRQYLDTFGRLRQVPAETMEYGSVVAELHELLVKLEDDAQEAHDTMHELMDLGLDDFEGDEEPGRLN